MWIFSHGLASLVHSHGLMLGDEDDMVEIIKETGKSVINGERKGGRR
jgi:hypothetical protein